MTSHQLSATVAIIALHWNSATIINFQGSYLGIARLGNFLDSSPK